LKNESVIINKWIAIKNKNAASSLMAAGGVILQTGQLVIFIYGFKLCTIICAEANTAPKAGRREEHRS
jgi:hypothetical protein